MKERVSAKRKGRWRFSLTMVISGLSNWEVAHGSRIVKKGNLGRWWRFEIWKIHENCGSDLASEVGWIQHVRDGYCQKLEDVWKWAQARRATRTKAVLEIGNNLRDGAYRSEKLYGGVSKACGSFLYFGSLIDNKNSSGAEMRRRIKKASETLTRLWQVWVMKDLLLS